MKALPLSIQLRSCRETAAAALVAGVVLAGLPLEMLAQQLPPSHRSVTDVRQRIPDEHDRPYFRETQSHRGWEIREPQFTVVAETSAADARWAAAHVAQSWHHAATLADRWTTAHHNPDFGLNALQVTITGEPLRERDAPLTTVNVTGIQTQVQINVAAGQPALSQQMVRLRAGAAFAMLRAAGLDSSAPPWAVEGLAAVAGRAGLTEDELKMNAAVDKAARFGGQQWRYLRATPDALAYPNTNHEEAASRMAFLLNGNDAEHAPAVITALQQATMSAERAAAAGEGFASLPGSPPLSSTAALDELLGQLSEKFAAWKNNPHAGEPVFEPTENAPPDLLAIEREMFVLLKLLQRQRAAPALTNVRIDRGPARMKIVTFDRATGTSASDPTKPATGPMSFGQFAAALSDPSRPAWATIDVDGSILLSTDAERVQSLLAPAAQRYSLETSGQQLVLVRQLDNARAIRGWLGENPNNKARPQAKFAVANERPGVKTIEPPRQP